MTYILVSVLMVDVRIKCMFYNKAMSNRIIQLVISKG
jgi:hypothetical protein